MKGKNGAIELSVSTIVVLVIGMSMLIMGILLVRNIFGGAITSVNSINDGVRAQINDLFSQSDKKVVVSLPNNEVSIKKGENFGIAFGIRNTIEGTGLAEPFNYKISTYSIDPGCRLTPAQADSYLGVGSKNERAIQLTPGDKPETLLVKIKPADDAPLCDVQYVIEVTRGTAVYDSEIFTVTIKGN